LGENKRKKVEASGACYNKAESGHKLFGEKFGEKKKK